MRLQVSEDHGASWSNVGTPLTAVANGTVQVTVPNVYARHARAIVTTAGVGVTPGWVLVKAVG